jgi:hypothetical protein
MKYLLILLFLFSSQGFSNTINIKKALICDYKEVKGMSLDRYKFLIEFERESIAYTNDLRTGIDDGKIYVYKHKFIVKSDADYIYLVDSYYPDNPKTYSLERKTLLFKRFNDEGLCKLYNVSEAKKIYKKYFKERQKIESKTFEGNKI